RHSLHRLSDGPTGMAHGRRVRARGRPPGHVRAHGHRGARGAVGTKGRTDMKQAAVIGAGTMGNGIAHVFVQHGWSVALIDTVPAALQRATATIRTNLDRQVKKGTLPPGGPDEVMGRIATASALDAAADASLVVEAASENP